jgi:hypothetical protein
MEHLPERILILTRFYLTFRLRVCLEVWLRLFFKVFFMLKCIKMILFLFLNNYF